MAPTIRLRHSAALMNHGSIAMALDLTLYTNPMSRGQIARWMLEEVG